jgi:hypothetical protein
VPCLSSTEYFLCDTRAQRKTFDRGKQLGLAAYGVLYSKFK